MSDLISRQRAIVHELTRLAAEHARAEPTLAQGFRAEIEAANQAQAERQQAIERNHLAAKEQATNEFNAACEAARARGATQRENAQRWYLRAARKFTVAIDAEDEEVESSLAAARLATSAMLEGGKDEASAKLRRNNARLAGHMERCAAIHAEARDLLLAWGQPVDEIEEEVPQNPPRKDPPQKISEYLEEASTLLQELHDLRLPQLLKGMRLIGYAVLLWLVLAYPLGWLVAHFIGKAWQHEFILALGAVVSAVLSWLAWYLTRYALRSVAEKQVESRYIPLLETLRIVEGARHRTEKHHTRQYDKAIKASIRRSQKEAAKTRILEKKLQVIRALRTKKLAGFAERRDIRTKESDTRETLDLQEAEHSHAQTQTQLAVRLADDQQQLNTQHRTLIDEIKSRYQRDWETSLKRWRREHAQALQNAAAIEAECRVMFPAWGDGWSGWVPPTTGVPVIPFGSYTMRVESLPTSPPWAKPRSISDRSELTLPALCAFPEPGSLLLRAHDGGRDVATETLRAVMFRLLTSLPAGRVRFVVIDPVGLGQNFAAFMNLADHDEALIGSRIWTEPVHIEQKLADLTAHIETVIQKYLRNRYNSITEYNTQAGEVAEPYRVLVIAGFPTNFTAEALRRLVSLVQSGPRCGVSTLISLDTRQALPRDFNLDDLCRGGVDLTWDGSQFRWSDVDFGVFPLTLHRPPDETMGNRILQKVGEAASAARRVEVPFEFIVPAEADYWNGEASREVSVPLGRSGATRRQHLRLGKGTSQHALVVGKTGSGKSTLLHALITNLALFYSPDEVVVYLVDFKKGVEFSTYAANQLPHARVIAIESDREFGLSVLQRLDEELKERGKRFRETGAQDLAAYRKAAPEVPTPRILLIIDEFQELFVEDDRIAQDASGLLDRLVRQGRAFGIHVLLGSQTLGGAYSLARSTIDQMAVRIALQCSEADAHLALSEDNSAARLLSRPGEAIYNDANGLVEGNDPFQVVWLDDVQRDVYLARVRELAKRRGRQDPPAVVFEGNAAADVCRQVLSIGDIVQAWLGEPMSIDGLTTAVFQKQNGSNLLLVGQQPEAAMGMLATGVISLAHVRPYATTTMARFSVVDGTEPTPPRQGIWAELEGILSEPVRLAGSQGLTGVLTEWTEELARRQSTAATEPSLFLILYALQRMRAVRREDDYSFGRSDRAATPDQQLATLLREGAAVGMHVLIWCDTLANLQRAFDRHSLREFSMRVAFQMSVADSSSLIDSPAANKLGPNRALFSNEDSGTLQKFRPYGVPPAGWLAAVRERLRQPASV